MGRLRGGVRFPRFFKKKLFIYKEYKDKILQQLPNRGENRKVGKYKTNRH